MTQKPDLKGQTPEQRFDALCDAFTQLKTREEIRRFLIDLCTPREMKDLSERWFIARLLYHENLSYRDIAALSGASTTTIGRVARFLQHEPHHGYKQLLEKEGS